MPKNDKSFKNLISRTKIYLAVIAILFVLLCVKDIKYIIPSIIIFALLVIYSLWTDNKRIDEISKHIQDVTFNMDSTIKNSLVNSPFPLIIMETDGTVLWKSTKFVSEFANTDISNIIKGLAKEIKLDIMENKLNKENKKNTSIEKEIEIGKNKYKIYGEYVKSRKKKQNEYMMTLYFIDNTNYLDALTQLENEKSCIGFVMIDNYDEMIELLPDDKKTVILAEVEKKIFDWAYRNNAAIVKADRKTYAYLTNQKDLNEIKDQKFDILDEIKEVDTDETVTVTLSIAISNEGNTNYEKYKSAQTAMDIVLGRGGDQAVVREDEKYIFFGGKSLEVEKRTKVKARTVARALEQIITEATNVIVMGHTNTDIDSMGSSLGIYRLAVTLGKKANIVNTSSGLSIDAFVEAIKEKDEYKGIFLNKTEALNEITEDTLLIVVDTNKNNYVEVPELLEKTNKIVVIDHHRKSPDFIENTILTFHEVYASSAAELVTEILQYTETNVELTGLEAEGLYAGIMMDTKNFTFKTGVRTFEAAAFLRKKGVDILRVKKWFQSDLKSYNQIADIVKNAEIINDSIAISIYDGEDKNANLICAKAADELLTISDVTASFVLGKNGDKIFVSGRSIGDINVQVILEKLGGRWPYNCCWCSIRGNINRRCKTRVDN